MGHETPEIRKLYFDEDWEFSDDTRITFSAWRTKDGKLRYRFVYIDRSMPHDDDGRALGHDNAENWAHMHRLGAQSVVYDWDGRLETVMMEFLYDMLALRSEYGRDVEMAWKKWEQWNEQENRNGE